MTHQLALTVIVDLIPGREEEARGILREMNADPIGGLLPFAKVPSVHFARLFILDETKDLRRERLPAQLILMSDIDAPERLYWDDLRTVGEGLEEVLRCCDGYPQNASSESRIAYLQAHRVTPAAMYVNTVGRTANQIHQEAGLREAIQGYLDTHRGEHADLGPQEMRKRIRAFVDGEERLRWARSRPSSDLMWRLKEAVHLVAVPLLLLLLLPVLIIVVPVAAVLLRLRNCAMKSRMSDRPMNTPGGWAPSRIMSSRINSPRWASSSRGHCEGSRSSSSCGWRTTRRDMSSIEAG